MDRPNGELALTASVSKAFYIIEHNVTRGKVKILVSLTHDPEAKMSSFGPNATRRADTCSIGEKGAWLLNDGAFEDVITFRRSCVV